MPALLAVGLPPHLALGTNKGQSVLGTLSALIRYARHGWVEWRRAWIGFPMGFIGSWIGAALVLAIRPGVLRPLLLLLLIAIGAFVAFRPRLRISADLLPSPLPTFVAAAIALTIGIYDGFMGPGTGTLLIVAYSAFLKIPVMHASAEAKVVNVASNLAALMLFAHRSTVAWSIALPMAAGQVVGGWAGAHLAIRGGEGWVRRAVFVVGLALIAKVARDLFLAA